MNECTTVGRPLNATSTQALAAETTFDRIALEHTVMELVQSLSAHYFAGLIKGGYLKLMCFVKTNQAILSHPCAVNLLHRVFEISLPYFVEEDMQLVMERYETVMEELHSTEVVWSSKNRFISPPDCATNFPTSAKFMEELSSVLDEPVPFEAPYPGLKDNRAAVVYMRLLVVKGIPTFIPFINREAELLWGYSQQDIVDHAWEMDMTPRSMDHLRLLVYKLFDNGPIIHLMLLQSFLDVDGCSRVQYLNAINKNGFFTPCLVMFMDKFNSDEGLMGCAIMCLPLPSSVSPVPISRLSIQSALSSPDDTRVVKRPRQI